MDISKRLEQVADLLEASVQGTYPKTASSYPAFQGASSDALTALRMGVFMQAKKASYLDMFKELSDKGVLK